jgi:hypothetical protein
MTVARLFMVLSTRIAVPAKKSRRLIAMISYPMQADQVNAYALLKFQLLIHKTRIPNWRRIRRQITIRVDGETGAAIPLGRDRPRINPG